MTVILLTALLTIGLSVIFTKSIRKYRYYIYIVVAIIALILGDEDANVVSMGYVPVGIFLVVMISGIMDKGILRKKLFMVRAELAVIGTILLLAHSLSYLEYYLDDVGIFNGDLSFYLGVFALIVAGPLVLTSFPFVRKMMDYKKWKRLHQFSYLFYFLVGLHLILIQNDRMVLYIIIFGTYFLFKVTMLTNKHIKNKKKVKLS